MIYDHGRARPPRREGSRSPLRARARPLRRDPPTSWGANAGFAARRGSRTARSCRAAWNPAREGAPECRNASQCENGGANEDGTHHSSPRPSRRDIDPRQRSLVTGGAGSDGGAIVVVAALLSPRGLTCGRDITADPGPSAVEGRSMRVSRFPQSACCTVRLSEMASFPLRLYGSPCVSTASSTDSRRDCFSRSTGLICDIPCWIFDSDCGCDFR